MADLTSGMIWSDTMPAWQRTYYEAALMDTLRTKSIMVPFTILKEDFAARNTGVINFTEVFDSDPNWNPLSESNIWMKGAHLDSRSINIQLEIHGDCLKFSDYSQIVTYIRNGDIRGLVREKIGINQVEMLDILARNAFLTHPNKVYAGGLKASRELIEQDDLFDPDFAELARTHLEEAEVPGVQATTDADIQTIACVTTPRVIHDIRTAAGSNWLAVEQYAGSAKKFSGECGTWGGVRFIRTNRLRMKNHGAVQKQTTLSNATVPGQGAAQTVDTVYTVGQPNSVRYVAVASSADFSVGDFVTIHDQTAGAGAGHPPVETDGTQETRRIVAIDSGGTNRLTFDKPLLKDHTAGDFITKAIDIHTAIFMGGPAVVYGVGERPTPIIPPKYDDLQMINRYGWRGFLKFQMFNPALIEVYEVAGTTD